MCKDVDAVTVRIVCKGIDLIVMLCECKLQFMFFKYIFLDMLRKSDLVVALIKALF